MSDNTAILAGYTVEVLASAGGFGGDVHLFIKPGTDLDSRFRAYDADECEFVAINGWLFDFEFI